MTLKEWMEQVVSEFSHAGFDVRINAGFPLVTKPSSLGEGARLIKFQGSVAVDKHIYEEGMLLVPSGLDVAREKKA